MLSNLVGLLELYRITGDSTFLEVSQKAWQDIASHRLYITGTTSSHEFFCDDDVLPADAYADVGEGCVTVTWLQLNWQLLRLTGEVKYADQIERTVYNQLLAAQNPKSGDISYFTPLNGARKQGHEINCCLSSEPRGIAMIPQMICGTRNDGAVLIVLFTAFDARVDGVAIRLKTRYPAEGDVAVKVNPDHPQQREIALRRPGWCRSFKATIDGRTRQIPDVDWFSVVRKWDNEQFDLKLAIPLERIHGGMSNPGHCAIQRGPQILAEPVRPLPADGASAYECFGMRLVPFADALDCRVWIQPVIAPSR
jgi:DUF1680 family protein